jgi:hypothetical protein
VNQFRGCTTAAPGIEFLTQLRRHLRCKPVVLIWDGLAAHRRIGSSYRLCFNFLDHTGLRL